MTRTAADFYHGMREDQGLPFDRDVLPNGTVVRIETDGNGRTVEIPEGPASGTAFGLSVSLPGALRKRLERMDAEKAHSDWHPDRVRDAVRELLAEGPMTREEVAERLGIWTAQANIALSCLNRNGEARCYPHPSAAERKYLWALTGRV